MKLSNSEKNLLYVLLIVATLVISIRFIMMPAFEKSSMLKDELALAQQEEIDVKQKLASGVGLDDRIDAMIIAADEKKIPYFTVVEKEYIQRWVMEQARINNLSATTLDLPNAVVSSIPRYSVASSILTYPIGSYYKDLVNSVGDENNEVINKELPYAHAEGTDQVIKNSITISVKGTQQNILNFVDQLSNMDKYVLVENLSLKTMDLATENTLAIRISLYSVHKENDGSFDRFEF
ncbi:MAG: type 4a pilus biogenesis protein PilO [Cellulosilyticaceae bacterium]